ncbi:MAG: M50 family metallopeptidase [Holosporales bacterium]|jgi:regulator of sigma E protease|nr:M50 family metallopeptidase [Holosporales bacterium]
MEIIFSTIAFVVLFSILVAVHELGHLIIARCTGTSVEIFSIGYGPAIYERLDKHGTKWRFSLIPLGGYIKMLGDSDITSVKEHIPNGVSEEDMQKMSIHRKKPWQKILVSVGGPLANLLFAIIVIFSLAMIKGIPIYTNAVNVVSEDSLAYISGIRNGDKIVKANDKPIETFNEIRDAIKQNIGKKISIELQTGDLTKNIDIKMYNDEKTPISSLGVTPSKTTYKKTTPKEALLNSFVTTYVIAFENVKAIMQVICGKRSTQDMAGVISIFKIASSSAESGLFSFIWMLATLSIILGAGNLLPIPVLDGGAIFISMIEWIIGRPINKKLIDVIFFIGLVIVSALMLIGIWSDLSKIKFFKTILSMVNM